MCEVLGKVCADEQTAIECTDDRFDTCPLSEVATLPQCDAARDCARGQECIDRVRTTCTSCMSAAWKLRGSDELYDLTSNPEEDQKLFKSDGIEEGGFDEDGNGRLNCFQRPLAGIFNPCFAPRPDSAELKLCSVQKDLTTMLARWSRCIQTPVCNVPGCVDCDDELCEHAPLSCG
jgi:hypothetical protein